MRQILEKQGGFFTFLPPQENKGPRDNSRAGCSHEFDSNQTSDAACLLWGRRKRLTVNCRAEWGCVGHMQLFPFARKNPGDLMDSAGGIS